MKSRKQLVFIAAMASGLVLSACGGSNANAARYTNHGWTTALGTKWDPNTWETNADSSLLGYVSEGFVGFAPLDTAKASWQWTYDMAESVADVTKDHKADLAKYHVAEGNEGLIYDIKLNRNAKWESKEVKGKPYGGKSITADDYIESFKILLDPARKNYRANLYYAGESAVAGGNQYYNNDQQNIFNVQAYADAAAVAADLAAGKKVYLDVWDFWSAQGYINAAGAECPQYLDITDETVYSKDGTDTEAADAFSAKDVYDLYSTYGGGAYFSYLKLANSEANWGYGKSFAEVVGLEKVDDYTIRYFCQTALGLDYFLTSLTSTWLVNVELYNALSYTDETTGMLVSDYNTSAETTISYGPYKMVSYEDGKQVKFTQNDAYYGYVWKDGGLYSETSFLVDGKKQRQWQTTDVVIDVLKQEAAKLAFEKGELNDYTPTADELPEYTLSSQLYQVDETYTMSLFFNTNLDALKALDEGKTNTNGVVLSNLNFRKAFSLAINRADWVTTTEAYKPAYSLMNGLYYYDVYNNPESQYRKTDAAMKAIVDLYGVEYGPGKQYATLKDAYDSITGYNLAEAKNLFKTAHDELVAAGLYTSGQDIKIKIAYKKGALESPDYAQVDALNKYVEAARQGSGFGKIEFEAVGNLTDRYADVPAGNYAIGYGAWGGAAFYPFRNLQVYMDPDQYEINEAACWDPTKETKTINVKGTDVTLTYQKWSQSMVGDGQFANESAEVKLGILAELERDFLSKYYRIPLAGSTSSFLLGYQQHYFTQEYNIMYDFGGFRLMIYDYNDEQWAKFVADQGGKLNYK